MCCNELCHSLQHLCSSNRSLNKRQEYENLYRIKMYIRYCRPRLNYNIRSDKVYEKILEALFIQT